MNYPHIFNLAEFFYLEIFIPVLPLFMILMGLYVILLSSIFKEKWCANISA